MQLDVYSFLAGMIATLVLGFVFRRMFAFQVRQTHIHHHPSPETYEPSQRKPVAKQAQKLQSPIGNGPYKTKASGHIGKVIDLKTARDRFSKNDPPNEAS